jgi:hypothetical protein
MSVTPETVDEFLKKDDWPYERVDENTWRSGFRGDANSFRFFVRLTDNWIFFTIVPFVVAPRSEGCERNLYRHLLRLNREINLAKFAVDDDNDVVLTVEFPTESFVYSQFKDALDALSYYADRHYLEVLNLAQDEGAKLS